MSWNVGTSSLISRNNYSDYHTRQSSDLIWNIVARYSRLQPRLISKTRYHSTCSCSYHLWSSAWHSRWTLLILLNLDYLGDRRELYLVKMIKSLFSGNCHPAMKLLVQQQPHGALSIPQSRTVLGIRRPSVVDATTPWVKKGCHPNHGCYLYIQPMVRLLLRLRGIMNPTFVQGTRSWKSTGLRELSLYTISFMLRKSYLSTKDASQGCPALIVLKEENNNKSRRVVRRVACQL